METKQQKHTDLRAFNENCRTVINKYGEQISIFAPVCSVCFQRTGKHVLDESAPMNEGNGAVVCLHCVRRKHGNV